MAGVYLAGALSFLLLGSAKTQKWAQSQSAMKEQPSRDVEVSEPLSSETTEALS
jgi:hypothetical protein